VCMACDDGDLVRVVDCDVSIDKDKEVRDDLGER